MFLYICPGYPRSLKLLKWLISSQITQRAFTCSKLTIETLEQDVKYVLKPSCSVMHAYTIREKGLSINPILSCAFIIIVLRQCKNIIFINSERKRED